MFLFSLLIVSLLIWAYKIIIKKTFDLDYRDHLGKSDDLGEELFENNPMPVPEAGTSAMMLMGVGLMAFVVRRRRKFL